jgi:dTDP-glucose 4,6-dehydratase
MQVRDWLHAEDHAHGIMHVLDRGEPGNVYNLGGGNPRTNLEITRRLIEGCGRSMESHVKHVVDRPGHDRRYAVDSSKAHALGWSPQVPFEDGLRSTVEWYQTNEPWWRPLRSGEFMDYYKRQYARR